MFEETGRLAWPALNKTQLSKFGVGLNMTQPIELDGRSYEIQFELDTEPTERNLEIGLRDRKHDVAIKIGAWFSLDGLRLATVRPTRENDPGSMSMCEQIRERWGKDFEKPLRERLLDPFRYSKNRYGTSPKEIVGGKEFRVRLHLVEKQPVLVVTRTGYY